MKSINFRPATLNCAQVFVSGECPLQCDYCWIPKSKFSLKAHQKIRKDIISGSYIDKLQSIFGKNLQKITLMGAEPTLSLDIISKQLAILKTTFPNLKKIALYTKIPNPAIIEEFVKRCSDKNIDLEIIVSLDGPPFITESVDKSGLAAKIDDHLLSLVKNIQDISINIKFLFKSTIPVRLMEEMIVKDRIDEFKNYFVNLILRFNKINRNAKISLVDNNHIISVASATTHSKKDGLLLSKFIKKANEKGLYLVKNSTVKNWIKKKIIRPQATSCFAGERSVSIGTKLHPCQATFLYDDDEFINSVLDNELAKKDVEVLNNGLIVNFQKESIWKFFYLISMHQDFLKFRIESARRIVKELVKIGEVDKKFLREEWLILLTLLSTCPVSNLLERKSVYVPDASKFRLFGNGAIEEMVKITLAHENYQ